MTTSSQLANNRKFRKDCEKEVTRLSSLRRLHQASGEARSRGADDKKERGKPPSKTGRAEEAESHSTKPKPTKRSVETADDGEMSQGTARHGSSRESWPQACLSYRGKKSSRYRGGARSRLALLLQTTRPSTLTLRRFAGGVGPTRTYAGLMPRNPIRHDVGRRGGAVQSTVPRSCPTSWA